MANTKGNLIKFYALYNTTLETYNTQCANAGALVFATLTDGTRRIYYNGDGTNKQEWIIPSNTEFEALKEALGNIADLETEANESVVAAINELVSDYKTVSERVGTLEDEVSGLTDYIDMVSAETANKVASVTASDSSVVVSGTTAVTVHVQVSEETGNILKRKDDGLYVNQGATPEYTIAKIEPADSAWAAQYKLQKDGDDIKDSATINIPKDQFLKSVELVNTGGPSTELGPWLKFEWQISGGTSAHTTTYVDVSTLVDCLVHTVTGETGDNALINATTENSAVTITSTQKLKDAVSAAESAVQSIAISSASTNGGYVVVTDTTTSGSKDKSFTIGLTMVTGTTDTGLATDGYVKDAIDEAIENTVSAVTTGSDNLISAITSNRVVTISSTETLQSAVTSASTAVQTINVSSDTDFVSATTSKTDTTVAIGLSVGVVDSGSTSTGLATDGYVQGAITEALEEFDKYTEGNGIDITESGDSKVISVQTKSDDYVTVSSDGVQLDSSKITNAIASSGSTKLVQEQAVYNAFCWNVVTGS